MNNEEYEQYDNNKHNEYVQWSYLVKFKKYMWTMMSDKEKEQYQ